MEIKKTKAADLESGRLTWFLLGLILILAVFFVVFEYTDSPAKPDDADEDVLDDMPDKDDGLIPMMVPHTTLRVIDVPEKRIEVPVKTRVVEDVKDDDKDKDEDMPDAGAPDKDAMPTTKDTKPLVDDPNAPAAALMEDKPLDFRVVESLPQFPGGAVEFMKWLTRNLRYPLEAERNKIQGTVVVQFVVERNGIITGLKVVKSAHLYLDREALRVLRTMPKWTPGVQNDRPCRTMVCIPVVFKL